MDPDKLLIKPSDPVSKLLPDVPGLSATIELLAKASLAASIAVYCFGFIVSVFHYSSHGIAPRALDHQTYLGAGIAFLLMGVVGVLVGVALDRRFNHTKKRVKGILMLLLVCGAIVALSVAVFQTWWQLARWSIVGMFFAAAALCGHDMVGERSILHLAPLLLIMLMLFGMAIYPQLPVWLGGGEPQFLHAFTMPEATAPAEKDAWLKVACRDFVEPSEEHVVCRRLYRVYESKEDLYVGIGEWDGHCPAPARTRSWWVLPEAETPRMSSAPRACHQRISNSLIQRLETKAW